MTKRSNTRSPQPSPALPDAADIIEMIVAADIKPGDIVLTKTGARDYAAFDRFIGHDTVTVWTAVPDQDRGVDRLIELAPTTELAVSRKVAR